MDEEVERSGSGDPILVHKQRKRPSDVIAGSSEDAATIERHIEQRIGKIDRVWHELISDIIHLDVHHVKPTAQRNVHTLVTTGMSDIPMNPPPGAENLGYAELLITLPPEWPIDEDAFRDEKNYWVVRLLKTLARFPHEYETWLWRGHTVPNGNPAVPYHDSTKFVGSLLAPAFPPDFVSLKCGPKKTVYFFSVFPIYQEEMDLKLRKGADTLFNLFDKNRITEVIDLKRKNVGRKWWSIF